MYLYDVKVTTYIPYVWTKRFSTTSEHAGELRVNIMNRKRIVKTPILDMFGNIEGYEAVGKDIAIRISERRCDGRE